MCFGREIFTPHLNRMCREIKIIIFQIPVQKQDKRQ